MSRNYVKLTVYGEARRVDVNRVLPARILRERFWFFDSGDSVGRARALGSAAWCRGMASAAGEDARLAVYRRIEVPAAAMAGVGVVGAGIGDDDMEVTS
jgi:hypothetical protein